MIDFAQSPSRRRPWPTAGNSTNVALERFAATAVPDEGGVMGSNSPARISVGMSLRTGSFSTGGDGCTSQMTHGSIASWTYVPSESCKRANSGLAAMLAAIASCEVNGVSSAHCVEKYIPTEANASLMRLLESMRLAGSTFPFAASEMISGSQGMTSVW